MSDVSPSSGSGGVVAAERARLESAVAARRAELGGIAREAAPAAWAVAQLRLGEALQGLARAAEYDDDVLELHRQVREAIEASLGEPGHLAPLDRAAAKIHLAASLVHDHSWERAVAQCRDTAGAVSREEAPELWGLAQRHFAAVLLRGGDEHEAHRPRGNDFLQRFESAVRASRAAVSAIREPAALAEAQAILVRALTALGKEVGDASLLDEAIAIGKALTARPQPAAPAADIVSAQIALGNALLARARTVKFETTLHREAVHAHRTVFFLVYDRAGTLHRRPGLRHALGTALLLLAESRSETISARLGKDLQRVEAGNSAADRLIWAVDVLAVISVLQSKALSTAMELLPALKAFADRHGETRLWEAWAIGVQGVCNFLKDAERDRLLGEVKACIGEHGTPDMRLAWAYGAWDHVRKLKDLAEQSRFLDDLSRCVIETDDPRIRSVWVQAACGALKQRTYCEANLDHARALLAEVKPRHWLPIHQYWAEGAATIHALLLDRDPTAAGALRSEIRAVAETTGWIVPWRAWMAVTVDTIKRVRWTDYAAARALSAEIAAVQGRNQAHDRERSLAQAHALLQDRDVKLAHGIVAEVLKPLDVPPEALAIGDNLRVSRLDASKAANLETVGRGLYCREMNLAGTAIEALPDDIEVTQRLDVSLCRRLKRLPARLKVGQLIARECTALEALPPGLEVSYLDLTGCTALKALPPDLIVRRGRLTLRGCERLAALPAGIGPLAQLDLSGCLNIVALPPGLVVTAWIDVGGSGLLGLPPSLEGIGIRWRGVPVDERIAFRPGTLDVGEILAETNAERRRVMMERFGLDRFMAEADAQVLDEDRDAGGKRRLLRIELPGDEPLVCVSVVCPSTFRQFMLRVPPAVTTCRQAVAWTAGFDDPDDYRPAVET
jgi:hypothetical protein